VARPLPRRHSNTWYLGRTPYRVFILREWSATFIALYFVVLVVLAARARDGAASLGEYVEDALKNPLMVAFHLVALAFALLHTVTWFQAVPKAMRMRRGDEMVPASLLVGSVYVAWLGASIIVAALFFLA
jgi:fumarate reductase subunit C